MFGPVGGDGIAAGWQPSEVSAQALADRRNRWGAVIRVGGDGASGIGPNGGGADGAGPGGAVWVGTPLRVHRRCQEPMFGISNAISYGGLMVYGTQEQPFPGGGYSEYPRSSWIDVTGLPVGKWVPDQGDALLAVLRRLRDRGGIGLNRVYVLSPFREVVFSCRPLVRQQLLGDGVPENAARDFAQNRIGTVHTTQGKEADVVILVLGADGNRSKRARDWAADPANLLNVAVSRARRRLFVIGDRTDWSAASNFSVLAERLPRVRWPG
jgi:superfamily I DNA and/or RNA helicase